MKENFGLSVLEEDVDKTRQKNKEEYNESVESASDWLLGILENNKEYKEKIPLTKERNIDMPDFTKQLGGHVDGSFPLLVQYAKSMTLSLKGLYELTNDISSKHQELIFTFKIDPNEGKWIEFTVTKQTLNNGDEVFWEPEGVTQWDIPKKILSIQEDPNSKKKFAIFEGSGTGIPLEQLVSVKK